jgi:dTDP-4-dehydrorhamnose reductase
MTKRVLVLGASGMLGHRLTWELADGTVDVHATVRRPVDPVWRAPGVQYHVGVDVLDRSETLRELLSRLAPDVVINAIGAIKQKDLGARVNDAFFVNGTLPHLIALFNPNPQGRVLHVSTDCVYRGDRGGYTEDQLPDAEDLYGRSKAIGELAYGRHLTIRTSIIGFEIAGHFGLLSWFFRQPLGSTLKGYAKAIYSGLPTAVVSRQLADFARADRPPTGLWHLASEPIDKYDLLSRVNEAFALGHRLVRDESFRIDRSLSDARFRTATGTRSPAWDVLVRQLKEDWDRFPYAGVYDSLRALSTT